MEIWKYACGILASILMTGMISWFAFGKNTISRAEALDLIKTTSPYVEDKNMILSVMDRNRKILENNSSELKRIAEAVVRVMALLECEKCEN